MVFRVVWDLCEDGWRHSVSSAQMSRLLEHIEEAAMTAISLERLFIGGALVASMALRAEAQRIAGPSPTGKIPAPVAQDTTGMFQAEFVKVGDDMFIGGQPTEKALRDMKARGVTTVVNLRSPEEMARVSFDEAALVKQLGMKYVYIPMRGTADLPYSPAAVKTFAAAMTAADGKVLLHCTVAWRASHLWAAYLIQERGVSVADALASARSINLMDDMRMGGDRQPLEQFLGRTVPEMGHPKSP
jgi:uncharacterized protein (TIGR01244 family)